MAKKLTSDITCSKQVEVDLNLVTSASRFLTICNWNW